MSYEPEYVFERVNIGWLVYPQSEDLQQNLVDGVSEEAVWYGGALFVEPSYGYHLACSLREEGYVVQFPWIEYNDSNEDIEEDDIL